MKFSVHEDSALRATYDGAPDRQVRRMRFVDAFAGLGGFHSAMSSLGHECVFACEIDDELRAVYERNFGLRPAGDIRSVRAEEVPAHDIFCAGFPCQPFSLAGKKKGTKCPESGKLIDDVLRIVEHHSPSFIFLENVPNVLTIADGKFWRYIQRQLRRLKYIVEHRVYSPVDFGIPQQRQRLFIVARRADSTLSFDWPTPSEAKVQSLLEFVGGIADNARQLEPAKAQAIEAWSQAVKQIPLLTSTSHTILAAEFGATYPVDGLRPNTRWRDHRGAFGVELALAADREAAIQMLPHYAAENGGSVPQWLRPYVQTSRRLYEIAPEFFDQWKVGVEKMPKSWQKLEWRGDRERPELWQHMIQFRASGIRVMRPNLAPSLVAMTPTQTPILGTQRRYLGVREAASLQALNGLTLFPESNERAFRALGNAVNAKIVREIARRVLN